MDQNTQRLFFGAGQVNSFGFDGLSSSVDDVFSTVLYTGDGTSNRSLTLGPNIFSNGGLSWFKSRTDISNHMLVALDNPSGATSNLTFLQSNTTTSTQSYIVGRPIFLTGTGNTGGVLISPTGSDFVNLNNTGSNYVVWNFRQRPRFFDIVDYTGNGSSQTINHNLQSTPGCIIVKRLDAAGAWSVWHKDASTLYLNQADPQLTNIFGSVTSSTFGVSSISYLNGNGGSFRTFLFGHNAGGFGTDGSENGISCGSFSVPSYTDVTVTLGFEPQFLLVKNVTNLDSWRLIDVQRGMPASNLVSSILEGNTSAAETAVASQAYPTSTGFVWTASSGLGYTGTHIYIAVRKPNEQPTTATSVFSPVAGVVNSTSQFSSTFPMDTLLYKNKTFTTGVMLQSRLTNNKNLDTTSINIASTDAQGFFFDQQTGVRYSSAINGTDLIGWTFKRARGFHDTVYFRSDGGLNRMVNHDLGVIPELIISKNMSVSRDWMVNFFDSTGNVRYRGFSLNLTTAPQDVSSGVGSGHTTTQFGTRQVYNTSFYDCNTFNPGAGIGPDNGSEIIAHLFSSCSGVSKLGTYSGNGSSQNINCGFSGSARFVLIKNLTTSGDWVVFDSVRGIVASTDSVLRLNSTAAQDTTTDCIDPYVGGFTILTHPSFSINNSGSTYMYMAIA